jgi:hypothetical protein
VKKFIGVVGVLACGCVCGFHCGLLRMCTMRTCHQDVQGDAQAPYVARVGEFIPA